MVAARRLSASAALTALLGAAACGHGGPVGADARLAELAAARRQSATPPAGPPGHLRALGTISFPGERGPITQSLELWCAGADRARYVMTAANGARNVFLLDAGRAWVSTSPAEWRDYEAAELAAEAAVRWELLRFPWGWEAEIAAAPAARIFARATPVGEISIELAADGRPAAGACAGVRAAVQDWSTGDGRALPAAWSWSGPSGRREESFHELRDDARFFDEAFRPPAAGGRVRAEASERLGVIAGRLWTFAAAPAEAPMDAPSWWRHGATRAAAVLLPPEAAAPADGIAAPGEWWLRWSFLGTAADAQQDGEQALRVAQQAGLEPEGEVWVRETPADERTRGQIVLLPVRQPPR